MFATSDTRVFHTTVAVGIASVMLFAVAAPGSAGQIGAWFVPQALAVGLWTAQARTAPASARRPVLLLLAGQLVYFGAGSVWFLWPLLLDAPLPFPSPVDGGYFASYAIFAVFLLGVLRRYRGDRVSNRLAMIDSAILTTTATAILWVTLISPSLDGSPAASTVMVTVLYPGFTLLLFGLAARTAITVGARSVPALLVLTWIGTEVAADIFYGFQSANGTFDYDGPLMLLWLASYSALAALAAHPGLVAFLQGEAAPAAGEAMGGRAEPRTMRGTRLAALLIAALAPLPFHALRHDSPPDLLLAAGLTFVLVTSRTALLAGDLGRQRQLAEDLDHAAQKVVNQRDKLARYAAIVQSTEDSVMFLSLDGVIVDWNRGAERLYGYSREEALGQHVTLVYPGNNLDLFGETMALVAEHGHASIETVDLRKDGSTVHTSVTYSNVYDESGETSAVVAIARDISDRKARDAEIHEASKLESLGRLSAGLAHEINSPIQYVGDNARFLAEAYQELIAVVTFYRGLLDTSNPIGWAERQERVREAESKIDFDYLQTEIPSAVEQTLMGIERVSTIVRAMKTFSHPGHDEQVPANLNEALEATITVTRHQVNSVADLQVDLADIPPVRCNIADLNQVFLNLIVNAADAIGETGTPGHIAVSTAVDGDEVVIRISDTGAGIPDDVRPKIFDPFFTTKEVGYGSGQGLPLARGVVHEGHGGTLTVESTLGVGTTFTIRLPIAGRAAADLVGARA